MITNRFMCSFRNKSTLDKESIRLIERYFEKVKLDISSLKSNRVYEKKIEKMNSNDIKKSFHNNNNVDKK